MTGRFEDRDGDCDLQERCVPQFRCATASCHPELWGIQIRVFEEDGQMLLNELQVHQNGQFTIDFPRPGVYRVELNPGNEISLRKSLGHCERRDDAFRFGTRGKAGITLQRRS